MDAVCANPRRDAVDRPTDEPGIGAPLGLTDQDTAVLLDPGMGGEGTVFMGHADVEFRIVSVR